MRGKEMYEIIDKNEGSYTLQDDYSRKGGKCRLFSLKSVIWLGIFMFLIIVVLLLTSNKSDAATITVDDDGGADYITIKDGLDAANPGDTVYVYNGTYNESLYVNKRINLTGEDKNTTIIAAVSSGDVIRVNENWVNISGFTITEGGWNSGGINLENCQYCRIINNNISLNGIGIYLRSSSNYNYIENNEFLHNAGGIRSSSSSYNTITNNYFWGNYEFSGLSLYKSLYHVIMSNNFTRDGISISGDELSHRNSHTIPTNNLVNGKPLYFYKNCTNIDIDGIPVGQLFLMNCSYINVRNLQIHNTWGGINVYDSTNIIISNNNVSNNRLGIYLYSSSDCNITNNHFSENGLYGLRLSSSSSNNIINNTVINHWWRGIELFSSLKNKIYYNNFIDTEPPSLAYDDAEDNYWDNGEEGNYWCDYSGTDIDGDGIGDTPYEIDKSARDNYPLMQPYNGSIPPDTKSPSFIESPEVTDNYLTLPHDNFQLEFTTSEEGQYEVILDGYGKQGSDNSTGIILSGNATAKHQYVTWDGKDAYNNIEDGDYQIYVMIWDKAGNPIAETYDAGLISIINDNDIDGIGDAVDSDDDNDGMPDEWEEKYGLNSTDPQDAEEDNDGDGYTNFAEYQAGTNPKDANSKPFSFADYFYYILFAVIFIPMLITTLVMKKLFKKSSPMQKEETESIFEEELITQGEHIEEEEPIEEDKNLEKDGLIDDAHKKDITPKEETPTAFSAEQRLKDQPPSILQTKIFCSNCRNPITLRDGKILPIECPMCKTIVQPPKRMD